MPTTLQDCINQYIKYTKLYIQARLNHDTNKVIFYSDKMFALKYHTLITYSADLDELFD